MYTSCIHNVYIYIHTYIHTTITNMCIHNVCIYIYIAYYHVLYYARHCIII